MSEPFCNITRAYALEMARIRAVNCRSERTVGHPYRGSAMGCSVDSILRVARHPPEAQLRGAGRRVRTASRRNIGCESSTSFINHYLSGQAEAIFWREGIYHQMIESIPPCDKTGLMRED